ncbi:MAG: hypothetical protein V1745_02695, partial [Patescibacteria group bacterium]
METTPKSLTHLLLRVALPLVLFGMLPAMAQAASLYVSPSSGTYTVGTSFTASVYVSSADQAMNAASGVVKFPADKVSVESISKSGSTFNLWVQEPAFSNAAGTVNFEGVVLNPGYTGAGGKILSIRFKAKAVGTVPVSISSGLVLANDGKGTNITKGIGKATYTIVEAKPGEPEAVPPQEPDGTPSAPVISSPTHPDSNAWYAQNSAKFTWSVPKDINGVRVSVDRSPAAIPTEALTTPMNSKELTVVGDGVWYFSVRLRNAEGWGAISRFKFQIDTEKPTLLEMNQVVKEDPTDPRTKFTIRAEDATSGIDRYEVQIGNESPQAWKDDGSHTYETPALAPGTYTLFVKAFDRAGNFLANSAEFAIQQLEAPVITDYPTGPTCGDILALKGTTTYPDAEVTVYLQHENDVVKSAPVKSDKDGRFSFVAEDRMICGIYTAWADVTDGRGAKSDMSQKVTIAAEQPAFL